MGWKCWHSSPRLGTSKAVCFPLGYPSLNTEIVCFLQTPAIIEMEKKLGITAEEEGLITTVLLVPAVSASYPSSS